MKLILEEIHDAYENLLPVKEEGMVVFWLYRKIKNKEIDINFTRQDVEDAILATTKLDARNTPQTSRIMHRLLHYFIEKPPKKQSRYKLTSYAEKFVSLVENKLYNRFQNFPLRESFEKYTLFDATEIANIEDFESWYEQGFTYTSKQNITDHLEALKDKISAHIKELSSILSLSSEDAATKIKDFGSVFDEIGNKADEIKDTLKLGNRIENEIDKVVASFYRKIEEFRNPQKEEEKLRKFKADYKKSLHIAKEVKTFFKTIAEKLKQAHERVLYASTKLNELQKKFVYQSQFKINTGRFLTFTLEQAKYVNTTNLPTLPEYFPLKNIPFEDFRFTYFSHLIFLKPTKNEVIKREKDEIYEKEGQEQFQQKLEQQNKIEKWLTYCKKELTDKRNINFTHYFYQILEEEKDIQIPLQVSHELLQFANQFGYGVIIEKKITEQFKHNDILTWNTIIETT